MTCKFYEDWQTDSMDHCQWWDGRVCRNTQRQEWAIEVNTRNRDWAEGIKPFDCPTNGKER